MHRATAWLENSSTPAVSVIHRSAPFLEIMIANQAKMIQAKFRTNDADQVRPDLHGIYQAGESANPFLPKLQQYRTFARGYGCDFESH
jgi:hypothetical protein